MSGRSIAALAAALAFAVVPASWGAGVRTTTIQPGPAAGRATFVSNLTSGPSCATWGRYGRMQIGTSAGQVRRPLLRFDLAAIPPSARVLSARLALYETITLRGGGTVEVHRVTSAWNEGSGVNQCTGDGATWTESLGAGVLWATPGGDADPAVAAGRVKQAGAPPAWDTFDVTALVRAWTSGQAANHGVLLRLADESLSPCTTLTNCNYWSYATDDEPTASLRPKLTVTYWLP
jgi:hypothetical protein